MPVQIDLWQLVGAAAALTVFFLAIVAFLGRLLVHQFKEHVDGKFKLLDERFMTLDRDVRQLERDFSDMKAKLPLEYQRREDAIRQEVGIIARLDGLAGIIEKVREAK